MAFKCAKVDEKLRKQIEEENGILTGIKEISSWMIDEEHSIVVWMQPSTLKKIDGDFSECLWIKFWWCPKMYAASNKSVVDIEKSDGKFLNVIEHLLGKTAGFTHRTAYPLA